MGKLNWKISFGPIQKTLEKMIIYRWLAQTEQENFALFFSHIHFSFLVNRKISFLWQTKIASKWYFELIVSNFMQMIFITEHS